MYTQPGLEKPSFSIGSMHKKFGEDRVRSCEDMITDRQTHRQTDMLITKLHSSIGGRVIINLITTTMTFIVLSSWRAIARDHLAHLMNTDWVPNGQQLSDQAKQLGLWVHRKLLLSTPSITIHYQKGKGNPYSITERRVPELILVLRSQPAGDEIINPAVGCQYFPPGLHLPPQPIRGLLPILLLYEQKHNGCEQFTRLLPDSVATAI